MVPVGRQLASYLDLEMSNPSEMVRTDVDMGLVTVEDGGVVPQTSVLCQSLLDRVDAPLVAQSGARGTPESPRERGHVCDQWEQSINQLKEGAIVRRTGGKNGRGWMMGWNAARDVGRQWSKMDYFHSASIDGSSARNHVRRALRLALQRMTVRAGSSNHGRFELFVDETSSLRRRSFPEVVWTSI